MWTIQKQNDTWVLYTGWLRFPALFGQQRSRFPVGGGRKENGEKKFGYRGIEHTMIGSIVELSFFYPQARKERALATRMGRCG